MNKKFLQIACLSLGMASLGAQTQYLEVTDYVGALSADETKDWTKGWTNFDPISAPYKTPDDLTTLAAGNGVKEITDVLTLDANKTYLLSGIISVKEGGSLVIPAGTVIRGKSDLDATAQKTNYAMIVVERGGKIFANGTADKPVVFTSSAAAGERSRGDWSGLLLFGKAQNNANNNLLMEGFNKVTVYQNGQGGAHGGTNDADNSGVLTHVRIEFAGKGLDTDKEVNGITFGSVGSGTTVDHVQVSYSNDDSFEWFGGTVNCKHLIAYISTDDDFDTDYGYSGLCQFGVALKHREYYDGTWGSGGSTSEGFESDNDATGTDAHTANNKRTSAVFSNFTMVGPVPLGSAYADLTATEKGAFRRGARIRRNSQLSIVNTIFVGYRNFLMIDGDASLENAGILDAAKTNILSPFEFNDTLIFKNNIIVNTAAAVGAGATNNGLVEVSTGTSAEKLTALDAWVKAPQNANNINPVAFTAGTLLVDPQNFTNPNFRPVAGSPAISGASFATPRLSGLVGVSDVAYDLTLGVYPNPVAQNGSLVIAIADKEENFTLINTLGAVVKSGTARKIEMDGIEKGLYVLKVGANSTKIVVE